MKGERVKVVHIIFGPHHEAELMGLLHREIVVPEYARLNNVVLAREVARQGRHAYRMEDGNYLIIIVCADDVAARVLQGVAALRKPDGRGIRAYVMPVEQVV